jgi:Ser/Thr protein kinase RdoA (MazF antagonist)
VIDGRIPPAVQQRLLAPHGVLSALPMPPGLSGALIFRCRDGSSRPFALRRWPVGTRPQRVDEIHRVVAFARQQGCDIIPKLYPALPHDASRANISRGEGTFAQGDGYLWDLSDWMPGVPLDVDATNKQIRQGAIAIANFHVAASGLGESKGCPAAVTARLRRCRELSQQLPALLRSTASAFPHPGLAEDDPHLARTVYDALQLLRLHWTEASSQIIRSLVPYETIELPAQYVLRDIHSEHLLFCDDRQSSPEHARPSGLLDFDAIRIDTPMTDLARWVGSFAAAAEKVTWEVAMAGYFEHSPSSQVGQAAIQTALARDLSFATKWISLANWVIWLVAERQIFPIGAEKVAMRIAKLVGFCRPGDLGDLR